MGRGVISENIWVFSKNLLLRKVVDLLVRFDDLDIQNSISPLISQNPSDGPRISAAIEVTDDDLYDGPRISEATEVTDDDLAAPARTIEDDAIPDEGEGRPRRSAKPTLRLTDYVYY